MKPREMHTNSLVILYAKKKYEYNQDRENKEKYRDLDRIVKEINRRIDSDMPERKKKYLMRVLYHGFVEKG